MGSAGIFPCSALLFIIMSSLFDVKITGIKGVGEKRGKLFAKIGAPTAGDLLRLYPRDYVDWSRFVPIPQTVMNEVNVIKAQVIAPPREQRVKGGMLLFKVGVTDGEGDMALTFFNNKYIPNLLTEGSVYYFRGKVTGSPGRREMLSPEFVREDKSSAIEPVYPQTEGLSSRIIESAVKTVLTMLPETMVDPIPDTFRQKYELCHLNFALNHIHFPADEEALKVAAFRLIFEELLVLQLGLKLLKNGVKNENQHIITADYTGDFAGLLPFSLTGAQKRAIQQCISDMKSDSPMNRLIQGDVGSGKTAVAAALCHTAGLCGIQSALMAPTEILAAQHFSSLKELLEPAGINVALLTGSVTAKNRRPILEGLRNGSIQLVIGTHALISDRVAFKNLGLVITDEQHRFGVGQRTALAQKGDCPHLLVMSATPIPRTLALMIYGDLDVSVLDELPPGRQKIETYSITPDKRSRAFSYIQKHIDQGRQAYIICPLIDEGKNENDMASVNEYGVMLKNYFPEESVALLHGRMKPKEKDAVMSRFSSGETKILVSTTVVEVGVDVPNAVIMMIENADRYGLSQLHQLRGRVGRGKHKSTCILVTDARGEEAQARMKIMCSTSDGFKIADEDLRLRGPGDFFGSRQHGLPQLKIADMMKNMDVLMEAQEAAGSIFNADPLLNNPEHRGLKAEVRQLFKNNPNMVTM